MFNFEFELSKKTAMIVIAVVTTALIILGAHMLLEVSKNGFPI